MVMSWEEYKDAVSYYFIKCISHQQRADQSFKGGKFQGTRGTNSLKQLNKRLRSQCRIAYGMTNRAPHEKVNDGKAERGHWWRKRMQLPQRARVPRCKVGFAVLDTWALRRSLQGKNAGKIVSRLICRVGRRPVRENLIDSREILTFSLMAGKKTKRPRARARALQPDMVSWTSEKAVLLRRRGQFTEEQRRTVSDFCTLLKVDVSKEGRRSVGIV